MLITDVIICEDEPYYCLYTGPWIPKSHEASLSEVAKRELDAEKKEGKAGQEAFIKSLPPTYLTYDYQGRVIRMDVSLDEGHSLTVDLFQDIVPRFASRLVHRVAFVHRTIDSGDRSIYSSTQWFCYCHDGGHVAEMGIRRVHPMAQRD